MDATDEAESLFEAASANDPRLASLITAFADGHGGTPNGQTILRTLALRHKNPFARELAARELERLGIDPDANEEA